jgi:hypothetical protein
MPDFMVLWIGRVSWFYEKAGCLDLWNARVSWFCRKAGYGMPVCHGFLDWQDALSMECQGIMVLWNGRMP